VLVPGATPIELQALTGKLATLEAENAKMKADIIVILKIDKARVK